MNTNIRLAFPTPHMDVVLGHHVKADEYEQLYVGLGSIAFQSKVQRPCPQRIYFLNCRDHPEVLPSIIEFLFQGIEPDEPDEWIEFGWSSESETPETDLWFCVPSGFQGSVELAKNEKSMILQKMYFAFMRYYRISGLDEFLHELVPHGQIPKRQHPSTPSTPTKVRRANTNTK